MDRRDSEVKLPHLLGEPVDLAPSIAKDHGLCDGNGIVEIAERVELPLLLLDSDEELLNTLERQLVALYEDTDRIRHKLVRHLEHLLRKRS